MDLNFGELSGYAALAFILVVSLTNLFRKTETGSSSDYLLKEKNLKPSVFPEISWKDRLTKGLSRSRQEIWGRISEIFLKGHLEPQQVEEIEELLFSADMSASTVDEILAALKKESLQQGDNFQFKSYLKDFIAAKMDPVQKRVSQGLLKSESPQLKVIMIVGVNGAGKTTTIGKLATKLKNEGAKVVVGACDTFRAAAVEQLEVWCQRAGVDIVKAASGADPSGVAYDAVARAQTQGADFCILDTAGRLHTAKNLMEELKKTKRVVQKLDDQAPHEIFLVIDAITGQNAIKQAQEFNQALDLTGLVFTKCDGSAKAGNAVSIVQDLQVPIVYIGVGETVDDLNVFKVSDYLDALIGQEEPTVSH